MITQFHTVSLPQTLHPILDVSNTPLWPIDQPKRMLGKSIDNGINMDINDLIEEFNGLINETQALCQAIRQSNLPKWVPLTADEQLIGMTATDKACRHFQDFWYQDGQDGRETRSCFGLIAVEPSTLDLAITINGRKESFKSQIKALQKSHKESWLELRGMLGRSHPELREQLKYSGLSRLHIKQTWRHIPVINRCPTRVGFNWYQSGRSIQKITVKQAQDALLKMDTTSDHVQTQLSLLNNLKEHEPLAKVQNLAHTMRANLFYDDASGPLRQAMNVSLPILIKANENGALPAHNEPDLVAPAERQRKVRSDRKIEDEPFLPSLRVHRYIN
jgi:hypothetical protein